MLTQQHIQEDLSKAYIQAVAARAGVNLSIGGQSHDYGVDGTFHQVMIRDGIDSTTGRPTKRRLNRGFNLDFQCKASKNWGEESEYIVYDLEVKTYNDLVTRSNYATATPLILILMCLPENETDWVDHSERELLLRRCCYWHRLSGMETGNEHKKRIRILRHQRLEPSSITELLSQVECGTLQ